MIWLAGPTALAAVGLTVPALLLLALLIVIRFVVTLGPGEALYLIAFLIIGVLAS